MKILETMELRGGKNKISEAIDFIDKNLSEQKISKSTRLQTLIAAEELIVALMDNAAESGKSDKVDITIGSFLGGASLILTAQGDSLDLRGQLMKPFMMIYDEDDDSEEVQHFVNRIWNRLFGDSIQARNIGGKNIITYNIKKSPYTQLIYTLLALVLGVGTGLLLKTVFGENVAQTASKYAFTPIYTVFMNALKMIVAPLVFFSISSSIADFSDIKSLGRIAVRVVVFYLFTSVLAIGVGTLTYTLFPIGDTSLVAAVSQEAAQSTLQKGEGVTISVLDTLIGAVPTDIITPFQKSDMLQIIFMAVVLGLTASTITRKYHSLRDGLVMMNVAFSAITKNLVAFIPLVVFCSMAKMMISMNLRSLAGVIVWVPVVYAGDILMIVVYMLLLLIIGRLNPLQFLKKYYPAMISAFTLAASNPALPSSIRQCDALGIDKKVYSFSLPLGATINMDGSCISLLISSLFLAKIFGIPASGGVLLSLFISIMVLSVGSPGVPGGNLVCLALLIPQIGVPAEAISLVLGLYPIVGMMQTCANVTGDAVVSTIVAKQEGMLDILKYKS